MKMKEEGNESLIKLHNVRFYNLTPRSINCLSYNKNSGKLALSRNDASIEIWDICYAPYLEKTIPGSQTSVEGLCWAGNRLFSGGLSGEVIEWNLSALETENSQFVTGTAIWCLDVNKSETCLAVGTEEGYLNTYNIADGEFSYKNLCDKQEGRILCCKFDASGDHIVTGSLDVIRIWNTKTGHAIHKMTMGRSESKRETIVWSLQVLSDFTIIAGDSRGLLTVWDGKVGVQLESHKALKADVLAVAVNEEENILICSGIDPSIRIYALTNVKMEEVSIKKWVKILQRSVHDHDVKAVICAGDRIISGGVDGYLGISSYSKMKQSISKHGPFLQSPCASATNDRLLLLRYTNYLEVWRLGKAIDSTQYIEEQHRKILSLEQGPKKLIQLRSIRDEFIVCAVLSPDGKWLAYSTPDSIRLFAIIQGNTPQVKVSRIKDLPENFSPSVKIAFSADSKTIFLAKLNAHVDLFKILPSGDIDYAETIDSSRCIKDTINFVVPSQCGHYLIIGGTCRTISVWTKQKKHWKHTFNLPKYMAQTTAIAIHENAPKVVATFTDGKIFEYDLEEMRFTCSTSQKFVSNSHTHCVNNIILNPKDKNIIMLHNDTDLFVLKKTDKEKVSQKKSKTEDISDNLARLKLQFHETYEHFVYLARLTDDEVVAVGVNPVSLIEQLPSALRRKKFGAA